MARWECIVCGLIYDEKDGWPEDGIAPGTRWADVPEDWTCPDCGVGKQDFELIVGSEQEIIGNDSALNDTPEVHKTHAAHSDATRARNIVILGAGLAGYSLAKEIRRISQSANITVVTSDGGEAYSKPALSTGYTRGLDCEALINQQTAEFASQHRINVLTRTRVEAIDTQDSALCLAHGGRLHYDDLVLAVGADSIRPPIKGDAEDAIFTINDLDDYRYFREQLQQHNAQHIAVLGAGLVGCEFTNDLLNGGFSIDAIDPMQCCLPNLIPEMAGQAVAQALSSAGAHFHFGVYAADVSRCEQGYKVTLSDDKIIYCDAVLCAVGVRPRTALAEAAGITTARGIVADRYLRTSTENIYTLGDCAEVDGKVLAYVAPLTAAARALAKTLTGDPTQVVYPNTPIVIKTPACPVTVSPVAADAIGQWTITGEAPNITAEFRGSDQALTGFVLTGSAVTKRDRLTALLD